MTRVTFRLTRVLFGFVALSLARCGGSNEPTDTAILLISHLTPEGRPGPNSYHLGSTRLPIDGTLTVSNNGKTDATGIVAPNLVNGFSFKGGVFPGYGGTCAATIPAPGTCTLVITFDPSNVSGAQSANVALNYFNGATSQTATVAVTAISTAQAMLQISYCSDCTPPASYDFGGPFGTRQARTLYVRNVGAKPARIELASGLSNGFSFKGGVFPGIGGTCAMLPAILSTDSTCSIVVEFDPALVDGPQSANLSLTYFDGASLQSTSLSLLAKASQYALVTISQCRDCSPHNLDFGLAGIVRETYLYLFNDGARPGTNLVPGLLDSGFLFKGGVFPGTGGNCAIGGTLLPGSTCSIVVQFNPSGRTGVQTSTLSVSYFDGAATRSATQSFSATAVSQAVLTFCDGCLGPFYPYTTDYGTYGVSHDIWIRVTNIGGSPAANLGSAPLENGFSYVGGSFPGTGSNCPSGSGTVSPGMSCDVAARFDPAGRLGSQSSVFSLSYFDGTAAQVLSYTMRATATNRAFLTVSEHYQYAYDCTSCSPFDFGATLVGSTRDYVFNVYSSGAWTPLAITDAGNLDPPFRYKGGTFPGTGGTCNVMPAPGTTCTIVVTFAPTAPTTSAASIALNYTDGLGPAQQTRRAIVGTGQL